MTSTLVDSQIIIMVKLFPVRYLYPVRLILRTSQVVHQAGAYLRPVSVSNQQPGTWITTSYKEFLQEIIHSEKFWLYFCMRQYLYWKLEPTCDKNLLKIAS